MSIRIVLLGKNKVKKKIKKKKLKKDPEISEENSLAEPFFFDIEELRSMDVYLSKEWM